VPSIISAAELKGNVVLSEWVSKTVQLLGPEGRLHGLCPFHDDHHPSLYVNDRRGEWGCFPCGLHGDVFDWIQRAQDCDFPEAQRQVAEAQGITFKVDKKEQERRAAEREVLDTLAAATSYFETCLLDAHREFLCGKYNLSLETIEQARLGFASPKFVEQMTGIGYSPEQLRHAGLLSNGDRFALEGRIIIPYLHHKRVVYLSGRTLTGDGDYKYIHLPMHKNHPEVHPVVQRVLYGVDRLMRATTVYLMEGVFDALAFQQRAAEIGPGVAAIAYSAIEINEWEAGVIRSYAPEAELIIVPDGSDRAVNASVRSATRLVELGAIPQVLLVPPGEDPASLGDRLLTSCEGPMTPAEAWLRAHAAEDATDRQESYTREIVPYLYACPATIKDSETEVIKTGLELRTATIRASLAQFGREPSDKVKQSPAGAALLDDFEALAYEQSQQHTRIVLWAKEHKVPVYLDLNKTANVYGTLAPHVGDFDALLAAKWPGTEPKERLGAVMNSLRLLSRRLPRMEDLDVMRSGLHLARDDSLTMVGQDGAVVRRGKKWESVETCLHGDRLLLRDLHEVRPWLQFTAGELNKPLVYTPQDAYELIWTILEKAWCWREPDDARLWALNCFALTWSCLWDVMPWFHITAESSSGKSCLVEGFLGSGGESLQAIGGPFLPISANEQDTSEAAVKGKYSNTMRCFILDECEIAEQEKILRLFRTARTGGSSTRGTQDGGYRETHLRAPIIISSINAIQSEANATRTTVCRLSKDNRWPSPIVTCADYWTEKQVDLRELRRTILLWCQDNFREVRARHRELQRVALPRQEETSPRGKENLLPAIACSSFLGSDEEGTAKKLFSAHAMDRRDMDAGSRTVVFEEILLNGQFWWDEGAGVGRVRKTVWDLRNRSPHWTANYGFAWHERHRGQLWVHPLNLVTAGPGEGFYERDSRVLRSLMRECPHFHHELANAQEKGGLRFCWIVFDFSDLMDAENNPADE
jgi:DNA primase catalytic core